MAPCSNKRPVRVGDVLRVEFWDHTEGEVPCRIEAFGRVRSLNRRAITLASWQVIEPPDTFDSQTLYTILRSAITSTKVLQRACQTRSAGAD